MQWITIGSRLLFLFVIGIALCEGAVDTVLDINDYYTDLQDEPNLSWFMLKETLPVGQNSIGPAFGSTIQVNHTLTQVGLYGKRDITRPIALHSPTSSFVAPKDWPNQTRWYQEDQNTQIFRLFPGEDNVRNERVNAPRSEAFGLVGWQRGDGWYEFSGRYTFLKVRPGAVLQIKHNATYWSMQLILDENMDGTFDLSYVKLRDSRAKTLLMEDVVGKGVDIRVLDDGENHKVFVDDVLRVENIMTDRPLEDVNRARWGLYTPRSAMDRDILIFTTGVYVGPAKFDDGSTTDIQREGDAPGLWGKLIKWLGNGKMDSWFSWSDVKDSMTFEEMESLQQELDAEPDSAVLDSYYAENENDGYGFI